jgi:hypothetical protein
MIRASARDEGMHRYWDGLTLATIGRLSREDTIDLLAWNDRNGSYRDEDNDEPLTLLEAHQLLWDAVKANRPVGGKRRAAPDRYLVQVMAGHWTTKAARPDLQSAVAEAQQYQAFGKVVRVKRGREVVWRPAQLTNVGGKRPASAGPIKYRTAARLVTGKLYVLKKARGISGFMQWDDHDYLVVTADVARHSRADLLGEYVPSAGDSFFDASRDEAYADRYAGTDLARAMDPRYLNRVKLALPSGVGGKRRAGSGAQLRRVQRLARSVK